MNSSPHAFTSWRSALTLAPSQQEACDDVHRLHSLVASGFRTPHPSTTEPIVRPPHVLYAAQRGAPVRYAGYRTAALPERVLVQSPTVPNWEPLVMKGHLAEARTFPVHHVLDVDDVIDVQVVANPIVRRAGRRVALATPEEGSAWLRRHLARSGLETHPHQVDPGQGVRLAGKHRQTGGTITAVYRDMAARCRVVAPDRLAQALLQGIGPAKAYGCGLLRIRQVK
ncbi:type I-E CRISPR-associated protein Cas6/Cse3/CasE [Streptomyces sp. NPDC015032]|uniref:type I-E CRISPR-associated protein Cas6/Cse3/CasE n=1 Tax=Streptomyces sp. NPDC015032 TaxID=3364937 RepID=UPI0036FF1A47